MSRGTYILCRRSSLLNVPDVAIATPSRLLSLLQSNVVNHILYRNIVFAIAGDRLEGFLEDGCTR